MTATARRVSVVERTTARTVDMWRVALSVFEVAMPDVWVPEGELGGGVLVSVGIVVRALVGFEEDVTGVDALGKSVDMSTHNQ